MSSGPFVEITANGALVRVRKGTTVAATLLDLGVFGFRESVSGEARGPVCGMGVCFECRVTIDGVPHERSCMVPVRHGMVVRTGTAE